MSTRQGDQHALRHIGWSSSRLPCFSDLRSNNFQCDRIHPCNQCRRYDKVCVFPQPEVPRRGKKYLAEVRGRVERLERLLAKHAPHVVIDRLQDGDSPDESPTSSSMIPPLATPFGPPPTYRSPATERMSDERGRHGAGGSGSGPTPPGPTPPSLDFLPSMGMPSPAVPSRGLQTPVLAPSMSPSSSIGQFDHPSSSSSSLVNLPLHRAHSRPRPPAQRFPPGHVHSTADAYERQPRAATGYEWDERKHTAENDGTASLSLEPTGNGYLGELAACGLVTYMQDSPPARLSFAFSRSRLVA